jgi:hypothetical protein
MKVTLPLEENLKALGVDLLLKRVDHFLDVLLWISG